MLRVWLRCAESRAVLCGARESCHPYEGNYVKDLMCLGRPLSDTIIVDNSPHSYVFQVSGCASLVYRSHAAGSSAIYSLAEFAPLKHRLCPESSAHDM